MMTSSLAASVPMWATFAIILVAVSAFAMEKLPLEITSALTLAAFLLLFQLQPVTDTTTGLTLTPSHLLAGFANPALITILALLVIGQGLFRTGALEAPSRRLAMMGRRAPELTLAATLFTAALISAFLNNTPVVVMFLPVIAALADRAHMAGARMFMPLSFVCILGGMTTLIGSSTNLLVAGIALDLGAGHIGFFDFAPLGGMLALIGLTYAFFAVPHLLRPRRGLAERAGGFGGKQFIAEIRITPGHRLVGARATAGMFPQLLEMTVRMIQRGERPFLPPFEGVKLRPGDVIIVAATRTVLTEALQEDESMLHIDLPATDNTEMADSDEQSGELVLAEAMVAPGSRLIGQTIAEARLLEASGAMVLGVERRARMIRITLDDIRLASGDVLLLLAPREKLRRLRQNRNLITLGGTFATLPDRRKALKAQLVFLLTVLAAASGMVPIVTAALMGAIAMVLTGILTLRQSARAFDRKIYMLIGAAMAMATALQATGGAAYIASLAAGILNSQSPAVMLSGFFLMIAILTNILSNHATAALFTPIAVTTASQLGADPVMFLHAVILAANCSFATPMAYQTNLLVMGPGHYRFSDFLRAGGPLVVLLWLSYSLIAPWYYGL